MRAVDRLRVVTIIDSGSITKIDGDGVGMAPRRSTGGLFSVVVACVRRMKTVPLPVNSKGGTGTPIDDCAQAPQTPADQRHHFCYGHH